MNGAVIPYTPVAVDFWRLRHCPHSRVFFLSHMHADHTAGLTSSWNSYKIYCSDVTRTLAIAKLGLKSELVVGLPLDEPVTINLDEVGEETMTVTLIDANHCPGSSMFVFEGYFGKILYTGDFRFCERFLTHSAIMGKKFDKLYLDNTYCDPKCVFPTRSCATVTIMEIIRNHPQHKVIIGLHSLGKEVLLHAIAITCKVWIGVDASRMETLKVLQMPDVFTCDVDKARIQVVKTQEITKRNLEMWNSIEPTIAILPTCLYVGTQSPYENVPNVFVVPYSDHCSFEELRKFVQSIRPKKIIPIVHKHRLSPGETGNNRVNMNIFHPLMDSSPSAQYKIAHSVECYMSAKTVQEIGSKKRVTAMKHAPLRKVAKYKKPCGVIFPPSPELDNREDEVKNCLAGGNPEGKLKMDLDDVHDAAKKVKGDEKNRVVPASTRQESDLVVKAKVGCFSEAKALDTVQEATKDEANSVSSFVKIDDICDSSEVILNTNDRELENSTFHSANMDEKQKTSRVKFNVYTGCSCDFARKVLEELMKNGVE